MKAVSRLSAIAFAILLAAGSAGAQGDPLASARSTKALFAPRRADAYAAAVRAYVWGYPLVAAAEIRRRRIASGVALNTIGHERQRAGPERRTGVGPNSDTLYSNSWLDLAAGPLVLTTPDFGERYYSFQLANADSSSDLSFGRRTFGGRLPPLFIMGPDYKGGVPAGMVPARSATRYALLAGRILVDGDADVAAVRRLQDGIRLTHAGGRPAEVPAGAALPAPSAEPFDFLKRLGAVLRDYGPLSPAERRIVEAFAGIGLTRDGFDASRMTPRVRQDVLRGLANGVRLVDWKSRHLGREANGWTINDRGPRFGKDYLLRAGVAKDQIFVTVPEEAVYPIARSDAAGHRLNGRCRYRIRLAGGGVPPVKAFWSITLYDDDGFMVANPEKRYVIRDRDLSAEQRATGIDVVLGPDRPARASDAVWLPTPRGPFYLMMRLYNPDAAIGSGEWRPPAVIPAAACSRTP